MDQVFARKRQATCADDLKKKDVKRVKRERRYRSAKLFAVQRNSHIVEKRF